MLDPGQLAIAIAMIILFALVALVIGFHQERRWRLLRDLPTSRPGGAFIGLVDVAGSIRCEQPLTSQLAQVPCAWYRWSVQEHWSRTVSETTTDAQGHSHTSTREESGWRTVASGGDEAAFALSDETGSVLVRPAGARVDADTAMDQTCGRNDPLYYAKGPATAVSDSDHRRRFHETLLPLQVSCSVVGQARQTPDGAGVEIALDAHAPFFVISLAGQRSIASGYFWSGLGAKIVGLLLAVGGSCLLSHAVGGEPLSWCVVAGLCYLGCCLVGWGWLVHNSLVELRARVRQGWSNVDVQLKRRFDLIAELMPLIQAITGHESVTQTAIAALRCQQQATPPGAAGPDFAAVAPQLGAVVEAYPDLISQGQFERLQRALIGCEDRIALARTYFNDIATSWNARLERVPDIVVARGSGMRPQSLMQHFDGVLAPAPQVQMGAST